MAFDEDNFLLIDMGCQTFLTWQTFLVWSSALHLN